MAPQLVNVVLGIWLTAASGVLGYGPPGAHSDHIVGPLVASFACIALWEATRAVRWTNVPLGFWLMTAPWLIEYPPTGAINSVATGIAIAGLSCFGGRIRQQFGGGWAALWRRSKDSRPRETKATAA